MAYIVTRYFTDAQDNEYAYHEGDVYPREGHNVSDARIKDLLSGNNFQRVALIKRVDNVPVKEEPKKEVWTREEISKMPFLKLKSLAKQYGIDVEDKKAAELKAELIDLVVEE